MTRAEAPQLQDYLEETARRLPATCALVTHGRRLAYSEIDRDANRLAHALVAAGVRRGDRVVVFGDNGPEVAIAFWAILKAGAVASIVAHSTRAERLARVLAQCRAAAVIADAALAPVWKPALRATQNLVAVFVFGAAGVSGDAGLSSPIMLWEEALAGEGGNRPPSVRGIDMDLASIIYTSGSTGEPKGVMMTHRNMMAATESVAAYLGVRGDDCIFNVLPFSFSYGLYQMLMGFRAGARVVLGRSIAFPAEVAGLLVDEGATMFPGVPAFFAFLSGLRIMRERDFSKVRCVTNAAAALPLKRIPELREIFPNARIYSMYGQTECKRVSYLPPEDLDRKPESIGIAIPNSELWIVREDGRRAGPDEVGELVVRGPHVMLGYWEDPTATAARLRPGSLPGESVLYTGDLCRFDEEGYLYFVSRMDEVLKSGGEKVAPLEIERAILELRGVKEAAVIGVPDKLLGEAPLAWVILEDGNTLGAADIQKYCQGRLENFKVPKMIRIVTGMPRTSTGKVDKPALRTMAGKGMEQGEHG